MFFSSSLPIVLVIPHSRGACSPASLRLPIAQRPLHGSPALRLEQGVVTSHLVSPAKSVADLIRLRKIAKAKRDREQRELLNSDAIWHDQILTKLKTDDRIDPLTGEWFAPSAQLQNFSRCGKEHVYRTCIGCDETTAHFYHCMIKWCPLCNWRIVNRRRTLLRQWLPTIDQPKHVVTTQRNTSTLTRRMIKEHTLNLSRLRRSKVFSQVKGGCVSVELTNESRGWHLHAHWLVDARFIDQKELAITWGQLVGQDYAIVKVIDARARERTHAPSIVSPTTPPTPTDYQRELLKYVVKGSDMARWSTDELYQFITAVRGQRFFFAFGQLFKEARRLRALAELNKPDREPCDCGCHQFIITSDSSNKRKRKRAKRR